MMRRSCQCIWFKRCWLKGTVEKAGIAMMKEAAEDIAGILEAYVGEDQ